METENIPWRLKSIVIPRRVSGCNYRWELGIGRVEIVTNAGLAGARRSSRLQLPVAKVIFHKRTNVTDSGQSLSEFLVSTPPHLIIIYPIVKPFTFLLCKNVQISLHNNSKYYLKALEHNKRLQN